VFTDFIVHFEVFGVDVFGFAQNRVGRFVGEGIEPIKSPEEVDGGGTGGGEGFVGFIPVSIVCSGEGHSIGGGDSDGRGTTDGHILD